MKKFETAKRIVLGACLINTVLVFAVSALANLFPREGFAPNFSTIAMILVFSLCISAAGYILSVPRFALILRVLIHYAAVAAAFYMIFVVWGGFAARASAALIAMALFTVIYALAIIVYLIIKKRSGKDAPSDYESQF